MLYDDTMRQSHMSHLIGIYTHVRMYDYKQEIACIQSCEVSGPSSFELGAFIVGIMPSFHPCILREGNLSFPFMDHSLVMANGLT